MELPSGELVDFSNQALYKHFSHFSSNRMIVHFCSIARLWLGKKTSDELCKKLVKLLKLLATMILIY